VFVIHNDKQLWSTIWRLDIFFRRVKL
jgi:hypothetical protein